MKCVFEQIWSMDLDEYIIFSGMSPACIPPTLHAKCMGNFTEHANYFPFGFWHVTGDLCDRNRARCRKHLGINCLAQPWHKSMCEECKHVLMTFNPCESIERCLLTFTWRCQKYLTGLCISPYGAKKMGKRLNSCTLGKKLLWSDRMDASWKECGLAHLHTHTHFHLFMLWY